MNYYLTYSSYATEPLNDDQLMDLLKESRSTNDRYNITGLLYYFNQSFIQLIEGNEESVKLIYGKICKDPRHYSVIMLKDGYTAKRYFPDWSMGFKKLSPSDLQNGYEPADGIINMDAVMQLFEAI